MRIRLQRRSNARHTLSVLRDDGSRDATELDSRSMLVHDLVHLAVESELGLGDGFWGAVAGGRSFAALRAVPFGDAPGLARAERLVGPMQSVFRGRMSVAAFLALVRGGGMPRDGLPGASGEPASAQGELVPKHAQLDEVVLDEVVVARILERMRRLWGHWAGTGFHGVMELHWPFVDPER